MNIDLDKLLDIALKGVRRAAAFLALGVNSARDHRLVNYKLPTDISIQFFPDEMPSEELINIKIEYEKWIKLSVLRELIETFGVYLNEVYRVCLIISINKGNIKPEEAEKFEQSFEYNGIDKKLKKLQKQFQIETPKDKCLVSISKVRNCITHRLGVISSRDTGSEKILRVFWKGMDFFAVTSEGKEIPLKLPLPSGGVHFDKGAKVKTTSVDRERGFLLGEVLELTAKDLAEICILIKLAAQEIMETTKKYMKSQGIQIYEKNKSEQPYSHN